MGMWDFEIAPGLPAGLALEKTRFWLSALEAIGISVGSGGGGGFVFKPSQPVALIDDPAPTKRKQEEALLLAVFL